ncbi:MAG: protein kinase [Acidobacteriota bacterium]
MSDSFIGRTLGKYQVVEKLGQGGMGKVYKGRQVSLNRSVAIKVLSAHMAMDPEFVERFQQEARVIATLQHENIVHVYDIDEIRNADDEAIYFIVMEFVDGHNLRERPEGSGPMPPAEVRSVGMALAGALDYAHRRGIVHRDIKSANVMVTTEGLIKLMDFGIAKSAGGVKTATGSVLGTPEYMAPEQARSGEVTPRSDIYSLGVLLYELSTGRLPFEGGDPFAVALKHVSEPVPPPRSLIAELPTRLDALILKALDKDPEARFESARDLGEELRLVEAGDYAAPTGRLVPPPLPPVPTPTDDVTRPHSAASLASAPASSTHPGPTVALPSAELPGGSASRGEEDSPPPPTQAPIKATVAVALALFLIALSLGAVAWSMRSAYDEAAEGGAENSATLSGQTAQDGAQELPAGGTNAAEPGAGESEAGESSPKGPVEQARQLLAAGQLDEAHAVLEPQVSRSDATPEMRALFQEIETQRREKEALAILEEARESTRQAVSEVPTERRGASRDAAARTSAPREAGPDASSSKDAADRRRAPKAPAEPEAAPAPRARPAGPSPAELWARARDHKDADEYHSLRKTLNALMATGQANSDAREWHNKIERWVNNEEEDLRDELEDHFEDLADAIEGRDFDDLHELWGQELDARSDRSFRRLSERWRKIKVEITLVRDRSFDRRVEFEAQVLIRGRDNRRDSWTTVRQGTWRGRFIDDDEGERFTSPWSQR